MEVTLTSNSITIKEPSSSITLMGENLSRVEYAQGVNPYEGQTVANIYNLAGLVVGIIPLSGDVEGQRTWTNDPAGWQQAVDDISVIIGKPSTTGGGGGGTVNTVQPGVGIDVDSTDPANPIVSQSLSGASPGSYTNANITIDDRGRVTLASNGTSGSGDVTGPASSTTDNIPLFADGTGKVIKDSGIAIDGIVTTDGNPGGVSPIGSGSGVAPIQLRRFENGTGIEVQANTGSVQFNQFFTAPNKMWYGAGGAVPTETDITPAGRALLDDPNAAAQRTTLGLGTAAEQDVSAFDVAGSAAAAQAAAIAASAQRSANLSDLASASAARANLGLQSGALINVTPQFIAYTGGSVANSTLTPVNIDSSADLNLPGSGLFYFELVGTYTAAATTTGAMFDLGGSTAPFSYLSYEVFGDVGPGDRGAMNWNAYAIDVPFVSSRVTGANLNRFRIAGTIQATGAGIVRLRFRSEVNASAITITDVQGFYQQRA